MLQHSTPFGRNPWPFPKRASRRLLRRSPQDCSHGGGILFGRLDLQVHPLRTTAAARGFGKQVSHQPQRPIDNADSRLGFFLGSSATAAAALECCGGSMWRLQKLGYSSQSRPGRRVDGRHGWDQRGCQPPYKRPWVESGQLPEASTAFGWLGCCEGGRPRAESVFLGQSRGAVDTSSAPRASHNILNLKQIDRRPTMP